MTTNQIHAPWTSDQVTALNAFQHYGRMHPFTCGALHASGQSPILVATHSGWVCPDPQCTFRQDWAHAFMVERGAAAVPVPPPADQTTLRAAIAEAIHRDLLANRARRDQGLLGIVPRLADAVLAVLPEQTDRAFLPDLKRAWGERDRAQAALARVRRLHDALDAETALTSPDDEITRGAAARKIAAALDGWTDPAELRRVAAEEQPAETRQSCACGQDGCEYCDVDEAVGEQPAETETQKPPTEADIVRAHVLTVHQIGEQLAGVESWMWEHLANVRDAAPERPAVGEQPEMQETRPECAHCWREIEHRGRDRWVHIPGGFEPCIPQKPGSPRAEPRTPE